MMSSPAASIQARTLFGSSPRQVPVPHDLRFRKENLQIPEKINESLFLFCGHGIARLALLIQSTLIADADRASIIRSGMSPYLQQLSVLRHRTILSDIEVIADIIKPTCKRPKTDLVIWERWCNFVASNFKRKYNVQRQRLSDILVPLQDGRGATWNFN